MVSLTSSSSSLGSDLYGTVPDPRFGDAGDDRARHGHSLRSLDPRGDPRSSFEHRAPDARSDAEAHADGRGPQPRGGPPSHSVPTPADSEGSRDSYARPQAHGAGSLDGATTRGPPLLPGAARPDAGGSGASQPSASAVAAAALDLSRQLGEAVKERDVLRTQVRPARARSVSLRAPRAREARASGPRRARREGLGSDAPAGSDSRLGSAADVD